MGKSFRIVTIGLRDRDLATKMTTGLIDGLPRGPGAHFQYNYYQRGPILLISTPMCLWLHLVPRDRLFLFLFHFSLSSFSGGCSSFVFFVGRLFFLLRYRYLTSRLLILYIDTLLRCRSLELFYLSSIIIVRLLLDRCLGAYFFLL